MIRITLSLLILVASSLASAQEPLVAASYLGKESKIALQDAILLALQNNLNLQIERTRPAIASEAVELARGAYDPFLRFSHTFNHNENPVANPIQDLADPNRSIDRIDEDEWRTDGGFSGILPLGLS